MLPALLLAAALTCRAPYVIDGDTLVCRGRHVRLYGMDAPELAHRGRSEQPFAAAARRRLERLTEGAVTCIPAGNRVDRYGRMVARCSGPGAADLGAELVREGLARDYPRHSHGEYGAAERRARLRRLGLWGAE